MALPVWWNEPEAIHAYYLSVISVCLTSLAALLGLLAYKPTGSSLVLCWGLENLVDLLSSMVVLWRFFAPGDTPERIILLKKREKRASVAISFILLLLGTGIVFSAMFDFKVGAEDVHNLSAGLLITMSLLFTIVFFLMTVVKLQMSVLLDSRALLKDGYCSLFGTILACSLFLNTIIIESIPRLWWLDPLVSLVVGIASLFIGLRSILIQSCEKKIPIWDPKWWIFSQGSMTMDEMEKVDEENKGEQQQQQQQQTTPSPPILYDDLDSNKNEDGMTDLSLDGSETKETEMTNIGDSSDGPKHNIEGPPSIL